MSRNFRTYFFQALLFVATLITTTLAGAELMTGRFFLFSENMGWREFVAGFSYSIPFLGILTAHEFGHYFTARRYKVRVSLPYYIPLWLGFGTSFGTMGAVIRLKSRLRTTQAYFDVGIAGPLAGFVLAVLVLWYGFTHLPPAGDMLEIHSNFEKLNGRFVLGDNLIWLIFKKIFAAQAVPDNAVLVHYPFLFAGYLSLLFTALNLLPIGQLDGGHILYGLTGSRNHARISRILFTGFVFYAGLGTITPQKAEFLGFEVNVYLGLTLQIGLYYLMFARMLANRIRLVILWSITVVTIQLVLTYFLPHLQGYPGWLLFAFVLGRFMGIDHPPVSHEVPLTLGRKLLGWLSLLIFVLCFTPKPLILE